MPLLTGLPSTGLTHVPSGTRRSTQSKKPSFFGIDGSTRLASCDDRVAPRVAERRPRLDLRAVVGAREVDDQPVAVDGDRDVHVDVGVARGVGVDVDVRLVGAVGPARDLLAEPAVRVGDRPVDRGLHGGGAVLLDDLAEPARAELCGADLRAQVADEARRAGCWPAS